MRIAPLLMLSAAIGAGAVGAVVKLSPASPFAAAHEDWDRRHAGPDSGRVAILLDGLGKTDPVICELIGDQIGNFWWGGERAGVGRLAATPASLQAAKDSIGGTITDPRAVDRLVSELGSSNACVRRVSSKMLGRSAIAPARLTSLLGDASPVVREAAAHAAGTGEVHAALPTLEKMLDDKVPAVAAMSAWAIGEIEDHASVPALLRALHGTEPRVRVAAIWSLGQMEESRAVDDILPALRDADPNIRAMSAEVLGKLNATSSVAALGKALEDSDVGVRRAAASALGELEDVHVAPAQLVSALASRDAELRHEVAKALAHIADPATTSAILELVSDPDRDIRKSAVEALGHIGTPAAVAGLTKALTDKDPEVRRAAVEALGETKDSQ